MGRHRGGWDGGRVAPRDGATVLDETQPRSDDPSRRIPFTASTIVTMDADRGVLRGAICS